MHVTLDNFFSIFKKSEEENKNYLLLKQVTDYYENLVKNALKVYEVAKNARKLGLDPTDDVEIPIARNMAERVEKMIGIEGIAERIIELEESGVSREKICFEIANEVINGKFGKFNEVESIDKAIRTAVAIITEGAVAAPIEGIAKVKIDKNYDGTNFLRIYYTGPIRSAGGTAQVISVLIGDFVRRKLNIDRYKPTEEEILRYIEEIPLYRKVANLQYLPTDDEIRLIVSNCPICIDGEPTEDVEVSGYRDLERVETNRVRGGMALVIAEGIAMKAPKIKKIIDELKLTGWGWVEKLIKKDVSEDSSSALKPKDKYLADIVAGRPVLSYPSKKGGFRLRYGRARNSGYSTVGINPATMVITDGFIAIGTQLKIEKPGKAGCAVPVTSIEGPTVKLKNGDVVRINSLQKALLLKDEVEKILDLGEILINFGDFLENNHPLLPSSYVYEWWIQEVQSVLPKGYYERISEELALKLCDEYNIPLHPEYTYLWHDITLEEYKYLREWVSKGKIEGKYGKSVLILNYDRKGKNILEKLLIEHKVRDGIVIEKWKVFVRCLGLNYDLKLLKLPDDEENVLKIVNKVSGLIVRAKAPTRIGARMGRPEKAKERKMSPPPHILFPVSIAGGRTRDIKSAIEYSGSNSSKGEVEVDLCYRICRKCGKEVFWSRCDCGGETIQVYYCPRCGMKTGNRICPRCKEETLGYAKRKINIKELYKTALKNIDEKNPPDIIKGVIGLTSKNKIPERLEKGILRAKHNVYVFKDGTIRFDATDLPLTHFKPSEINVSVEKLKMLGYKYDYNGNELKSDDQVLELFPQDVIIPKKAAEYFVKVAKFIDDLLVKFYKMKPFYNVNKPEDLIGHLVVGLAPHTSAGVLGRIIGFAEVNACYAHPYFHAAKRRNCDGDEDSLILLLDALLNFSKEFLPDKRGGRMDAPLVLTAIIDPKEIDSEVHNMDIVANYPLEFYYATLEFANPKELIDLIERVENRIHSELKYCNILFTHETESITLGVKESTYKSFETMQEKVYAQMDLAKKIIAIDVNDVAEKIITSHFLPDIVGNLRAFSKQEFRCTSCNEKYRRIPLIGKCIKCGGNLTLSVHSGSIKKYLEISKYLARNYKIRKYTLQRLELIEKEIESIFEDESKKQVKISDFFS